MPTLHSQFKEAEKGLGPRRRPKVDYTDRDARKKKHAKAAADDGKKKHHHHHHQKETQ